MEVWSPPVVDAEWRKRYNGPSFIKYCPVPVRHGCVLVAPAWPVFYSRAYDDIHACFTRGSVSQLPDLALMRLKARYTLHIYRMSELWPLIQIQRPKWGFHRGWSKRGSLLGEEMPYRGGRGGFAQPALVAWGGGGGPRIWSPTTCLPGKGARYRCHFCVILAGPRFSSLVIPWVPGSPCILLLTSTILLPVILRCCTRQGPIKYRI
jgi:hypothetical protein